MAHRWRTDGAVTVSADDGAQPVSLPGTVGVAVLTLALTRLLPPSVPAAVPRVIDRVRVRCEVVVLVLCSVVFTFTVLLPGPEVDYILWKVALLLLVPGLYLGWRFRSRGPSMRIAARGVELPGFVLVPALVYVGLTEFGPLAPSAPTGWPDPVTLIVAALITALTAGLGEEVFYRYWLQSRLEALTGRWTGILLASITYGLMHALSHDAGRGWDLAVTTPIASQGVFGVFLGYLWSKYRRFWVCVLVHVASNGTLVVLYLLGLT